MLSWFCLPCWLCWLWAAGGVRARRVVLAVLVLLVVLWRCWLGRWCWLLCLAGGEWGECIRTSNFDGLYLENHLEF